MSEETSETIEPGETRQSDAEGPAKPEPASEEKNKATAAGTGEKKPEEMTDEERKEHVFGLYQKALDEVDWGWKNKSGTERDVAHQSVTNAERAYVIAGLYDKDRADKAYESVARRPPKPELQKRIEDARSDDRSTAINDLTSSLSTQSEKQRLLGLNLSKQQLEKQMGDWEVALGDINHRKRDHRERAASELIKPERPGQGDDSGLDMMLRSIVNGFKAGRHLRVSSEYGKKLGEVNKMVGSSTKEHGRIVGEIAEFDPTKAPATAATKGIVGRTRARFAGATGIVMQAMDGLRKRMQPEAVDVAATAPQQNAQQNRAAAMQAMARQAGQGPGIGI